MSWSWQLMTMASTFIRLILQGMKLEPQRSLITCPGHTTKWWSENSNPGRLATQYIILILEIAIDKVINLAHSLIYLFIYCSFIQQLFNECLPISGMGIQKWMKQAKSVLEPIFSGSSPFVQFYVWVMQTLKQEGKWTPISASLHHPLVGGIGAFFWWDKLILAFTVFWGL